MDRLRVGLLLLFLCPFLVVAKEVKLASPNKVLHAEVSIDEHVSIRVLQNKDVLFAVRNIYLNTDQGYIPEKSSKVRSVKTKAVDRMVVPEIKEKRSVLPTPAPPNRPTLPPRRYGSNKSITLIPVSRISRLVVNSSYLGASLWIPERGWSAGNSGPFL